MLFGRDAAPFVAQEALERRVPAGQSAEDVFAAR